MCIVLKSVREGNVSLFVLIFFDFFIFGHESPQNPCHGIGWQIFHQQIKSAPLSVNKLIGGGFSKRAD